MKNKKRFISGLTLIVFLSFTSYANAADCIPQFLGNYTVEGNCTWPTHPVLGGTVSVFGNISVGTRTVTVPTGRIVGINLTSQKVTFSSGKMLFQGTAKMDNSSGNRYYRGSGFSINSGITNCPAGLRVLNQINPTIPSNYQGGTVKNVASSGTFFCGK